MPPLIVFIVGLIAMILFMTVSVWLAVVIVTVTVLACLFRIRHLGRSRSLGGLPRNDSAWPFFWMNSDHPGAPNQLTDEPGHPHQGRHHHHGTTPDASSGGHSQNHPDPSSFGGGHRGGFDGGGGGHHGGGDSGGGGGGHH